MKQLRNETEAMTIICNIQNMQRIAYGNCFEYNDFDGNSIEELRKLQDEMIPIYNNSINKAK